MSIRQGTPGYLLGFSKVWFSKVCWNSRALIPNPSPGGRREPDSRHSSAAPLSLRERVG
jgi:hypothetical protein